MVGVTEAGPSTPTILDLVQNMDEYNRKYAPSGNSYLPGVRMHDSAETFFAEGGNRLYVGRVYGAAAVAASVTLKDAVPADTLVVKARNAGEWGNDLKVTILTTTEVPAIPAGSFRIRLLRTSTGAVLDESYDLVDVNAALQWAYNNTYLSLQGSTGSGDPVAGT